MKSLIAAIFKLPLVWTQDHDGEVRLRIARRSPFGGAWVKGVSGTTVGHLTADGKILNGRYLESWMPANKHAQLLFGGKDGAA